ncbi:MAG: hypothetical protein AB7E72_20155 [Lysobacterales bacterium]
MRKIGAIFMLAFLHGESVLADHGTELEAAQRWTRETVSGRLSEEGVARNSGSYRTTASQILSDFASKYGRLSKLDPHELTDNQLTSGWEIFVTMAATGTYVGRKSTDYPAVRDTAAAAIRVYEEIQSRRKPTMIEALSTYSAAFALREWDLEARIRADLGPLQNMPNIRDDPSLEYKLSLWQVDSDVFAIRRVPFELTDDIEWIVIAFADCAVAKQAAKDISSNKDLMDMFDGHSLWLTPPVPDSQSFPAIYVWNARHPKFELKFIHHWDEWPMLDVRPASPTFIRIKDKKVVGVHSGWGSGEYLPEVRKLLLDLEKKAEALPD